MQKTVKVFAVIFIIAFVSAILAFGESVFASSPSRLTCLLAGFDDAAENTDVLSIVDFDFSANAINVIQIPRDTYFHFGNAQNKINQVFPTLRAAGKSKHRALRSLTETVGEALTIPIDAYVGITTGALFDAITSLGGVYIDTDKDITLKSQDGKVLLQLNKGENFLSAEQALTLIRYRSGYVRADLDRLDAQKLFIRGLYKTILQNGGYKTLAITLLSLDSVTTNISLAQIVSRMGRTPDISGMTIEINTIKGAAVQDNRGIWYYSLNRRGAIEMLKGFATFETEAFDKKRSFLKADDKNFSNIYNS
jgi:LCP family protein required for cell wall assembly